VIILLLWVIQIGFLKVFFERYQIRSIENIAKEISEYQGDIGSKLEAIAYEADICIEIYLGEVSRGYNIMNRDCLLASNKKVIIDAKLALLTSNTNKTLLQIDNPANQSKSLIYGLRLNDAVYIFFNTKLEDVSSTHAILRSQLIYVTLVVVLLDIMAAYFVAGMLNEPILKITQKARKMAEGNYEHDFTDYGIAEINELNDVLNYARSEAQNTDELRRDLMANVSHDLKTPLTMIKAYAEMARDINQDKPEKRANNLAVIIAEVDRLNTLVNDILDLSQMQSSNPQLKIEDYDLIKEMNEIIQRYAIIKEIEKYQFIVKMPKVAIVRADRNKINQVIYNLINNAINYTGNDLVVKINIKAEKNQYLVEIIDTGKGIPREELNLIWTKYYKKEKNHQRNVIGTGLGLSIVKSILTMHDFSFGVESEKGKGSCFYFYLSRGEKKIKKEKSKK